MAGFYKTKESEQVVWWATFNQECIDRAATFAAILTIGELAKIQAVTNHIAQLVNGDDNAQNFAKEVATYKNIWMDSPLGTGAPANPVPPAGMTPPANTVVGFEAYARLLARQLNAHPAMTDAIRAAMGIAGTAPELGTVRIIGAGAVGASQVQLKLGMAAFPAVAIYMKRNNVVTRLGVSLNANYTDTTDPLVAGQSESREYWIRGILDNVEQGDISASVFVATTP